MEGWTNPLQGRETRTVWTDVHGQRGPIIVDRDTGSPIRDRFNRLIAGEAACGGLRVYARDGHEVVSGWVRQGDLRVCMYTGESYIDGKRVRRPDRGPRSGFTMKIAGERHSNRRYDD